MTGLVSLVGAGPGDPELLTLKAATRLEEADVVLYDALVSAEILTLAKNAQTFDVGKRKGRGSIAQAAINQLMIHLARGGDRVVRLKGGDPFVLGRGGEEALALAEAGVPYEIVPSISSALAAPALAGIPVTHRGVASAFVVLSGHSPEALVEVLDSVTPHAVTLVVLMGPGHPGDARQVLDRTRLERSDSGRYHLQRLVRRRGRVDRHDRWAFPRSHSTPRRTRCDHHRRGRPPCRTHIERPCLIEKSSCMSVPTWKEQLEGRIPPGLGREIDIYETQIELRRQDKLDEKLFGESRLRRGVYGQRYDNGQRNDGNGSRMLRYPSGDLTKGPQTLWDAPGMQRIKIPFGRVTPDQLEVLAELAEEYSVGVLHVTTRQDFQLHYVHIEDTPDMMRRLAAVGITTREACGNSVRNVTACPLAGVCKGETFDVTPYASALAYFLLGHPDAQDFGRKFKIAFSGCKDEPCGLTTFHDLGFIARTRTDEGRTRRGFELYVGGGLGAVPYEAKLFDPFLPEEELLPIAQAICRVFARLGEKKNRARARLKFLVGKLGIEELRRLVHEERKQLPQDPRWTEYLSAHDGGDESTATVQSTTTRKAGGLMKAPRRGLHRAEGG